MKHRITQIDIARVAGVHNTTVSLALRNSPMIPESTRKRIQAIAEELGYSPDPTLQALIAYRNGRMPNRRQETVAYVTNWYTKWGWEDHLPLAKMHAGAQRRAGECGYQLEHFWLGEPGMTARRLNSMLFHRGITGVVLAAHRPDPDLVIDLDWTRLSAVAIGWFPSAPKLHRVVDDPFGAMRQACRRLAAAGCHRVGLVMPRAWDELSDGRWLAAFHGELAGLAGGQRLAPLIYGGEVSVAPADGVVDLRDLAAWLQRDEPEAVIGFGPAVRHQLEALGFDVPRDLAFVDLAVDVTDHRSAGLRENGERAGEIAIDLLVRQLQQNARGVPSAPTNTSVEACWVEGDSLPARHNATSWYRTLPGQPVELLVSAP